MVRHAYLSQVIKSNPLSGPYFARFIECMQVHFPSAHPSGLQYGMCSGQLPTSSAQIGMPL